MRFSDMSSATPTPVPGRRGDDIPGRRNDDVTQPNARDPTDRRKKRAGA